MYIERLFAHEDQDLERTRHALRASGKEGINVGPTEGKILALFTKLVKAKTVLEIGTLYGYSTLWFAKALPKDGKVITIEFSEDNYQAAKKLISASQVAHKVQILHGDANKVLETLKVRPDIVFIDADKVNYPNYLRWAIEHVAKGGLIIGDNTFLFGHMIGEDRGETTSEKAKKAMTEFNETLASHPQFCSVIIPTFEGMTVALRLDR
jgi:predicted O-methyltransferase YrrM